MCICAELTLWCEYENVSQKEVSASLNVVTQLPFMAALVGTVSCTDRGNTVFLFSVPACVLPF